MLPPPSRPEAIIGSSCWEARTSPTHATSWSGRTRAASPRYRGPTTPPVNGTQRSALSPDPAANDGHIKEGIHAIAEQRENTDVAGAAAAGCIGRGATGDGRRFACRRGNQPGSSGGNQPGSFV